MSSTGADVLTRILVTGSLGQIGQELMQELRHTYGAENIIASDVQKGPEELRDEGPFLYLDVRDKDSFMRAVVDYEIDWIVHNASILSATGEKYPQLAMEVNARGFENAIEVAKRYNLRILAPSSIAAFGPSTPSNNTPDITIMRPNTMYGITKVWVELLGEYYYNKWDVDFRSLRYPGIISYKAPPGGGTTDYAVDIFYEALRHHSYESFLRETAKLPMMYMPDCIKGTMMLLGAENDQLQQRVYNLGAMSFSPAELGAEIKRHIPEFTITYNPDYRQQIADSWPNSIDDSAAREHWGWNHSYDLTKMTKDMLDQLSKRLGLPYSSALLQPDQIT